MIVKLGEISKNGGKYGIGASAVNYKTKYKYLRITDISDDGKFDINKLPYVDDINAPKYLVEKNDIVFARTGNSTGRNAIIGKDFSNLVYAGFLIKFSMDEEKCCPKYVSYFCQTNNYYGQVASSMTGSTRGNMNVNHFSNIVIKLPSMSEQKKIADKISVYDDKIENNNKIINTLEEMASLLYKRYFVDFEFSNNEGKPYKSNGGEFKDSELGKIPTEWSVKKIGDLFDTVLGGTPSRKMTNYWNGDINWINSGKMTDIRITKCSEKITEIGMNKSATKLMRKGTVVLAITGYLTEDSISILEINTCANQSVIGVLENDKFESSFIYLVIKNTINELYKNKTGSAQQHINKNNVNNHLIIIPPREVYTVIMEEIRPLMQCVSNLCMQNDILVETRDLLINELIK